MPLTLYHHPLASFCHKVLVALYENDTPFNEVILDNDEAQTAFRAIAPLGKFPVLHDADRGMTLPETSIIIEYLDTHYPGPRPLLPSDDGERLETRLWDRFFDLYVELPMQTIVGDRLRPENARDARGVEDAHAELRKIYAMIEGRLAGRTWIVGDQFSMADCAAAPALFYAGIVSPFSRDHPRVSAYFDRLVARPSFARTLAEARPYFHLFPFRDDIPARFLGDGGAAAA